MTSKTPSLSLIVPTRERAAYLGFALRTCTDNQLPDLEILVLDNASTDNTSEVMAGVTDPRVRYVRNNQRLSMRDNFEKGILESRGDIIGFIGDDDGVLPNAADAVLAVFGNYDVEAVSASRAHYFWPDLTASRRGSALLPRGRGVQVLDSKKELRRVLQDCDYYRLPCLYHGFAKRSLVERIQKRQGRFFLSSQVDMFSAIAMSMEGVRYAFSESPLIINGASKRSNGASHFGGGTTKEKTLWQKEDDIGFLPGFETHLRVSTLIVESVLRYGSANGIAGLSDVLDATDVKRALANEVEARITAGQSLEQAQSLYATAGLPVPPLQSAHRESAALAQRVTRLAKSFLRTMPLDMDARGITDVYAASRCMGTLHAKRATGLTNGFLEQVTTAMKIAGKTSHA